MKTNTGLVRFWKQSAVFALAYAVCIAGAAGAENVTFTYKPIEKGVTRQVTWSSSAEMRLEVAENGAKADSVVTKNEESRKVREVVLEANEQAPTKLRVTFDELKLSVSNSKTGDRNQTLPVNGKAYVVELKDGAIAATQESGEAVTDIEMSIISKQYKSLGKPDRVAKYFDAKHLKVGEMVELPAEVLGQLGEDRAGAKVASFVMTLKGTRDLNGQQCAVFDAQMNISAPTGMMGLMTAQLAGEMVIEISTCRPLSMELNGPLTVKGGGQMRDKTIELEGTGKARLMSKTEFGKSDAK